MRVQGKLTKEQIEGLDRISKDKKNQKRLKSQSLDKDAFLRLMLEQLKNQDPLSPMDNKDFMGQMAQFSSMEQMSNMVKTQKDIGKMTAMLTKQLDGITDFVKAGGSDKAILKELVKLNKMLETYITGGTGNKEEPRVVKADVDKDIAAAVATKANPQKEA